MGIHPGLSLKGGVSRLGVIVVKIRPLNLDMTIGRRIRLEALGFLAHPIPIDILIPLGLIVSIRYVLIQSLRGLVTHKTDGFLDLALVGKVRQGLVCIHIHWNPDGYDNL